MPITDEWIHAMNVAAARSLGLDDLLSPCPRPAPATQEEAAQQRAAVLKVSKRGTQLETGAGHAPGAVSAGAYVLLRHLTSYLDARLQDGGKLVHVYEGLAWSDSGKVLMLVVNDAELSFI